MHGRRGGRLEVALQTSVRELAGGDERVGPERLEVVEGGVGLLPPLIEERQRLLGPEAAADEVVDGERELRAERRGVGRGAIEHGLHRVLDEHPVPLVRVLEGEVEELRGEEDLPAEGELILVDEHLLEALAHAVGVDGERGEVHVRYAVLRGELAVHDGAEAELLVSHSREREGGARLRPRRGGRRRVAGGGRLRVAVVHAGEHGMRARARRDGAGA